MTESQGIALLEKTDLMIGLLGDNLAGQEALVSALGTVNFGVWLCVGLLCGFTLYHALVGMLK